MNRISRSEDRAASQASHTTITRTMCNRTEVWQRITPNWLDGQKILMLSGLIRAENGLLVKARTETGSRCPTCHNPINKHITMHRAFECRQFESSRNRFRELIAKEDSATQTDNLEELLSNKRSCQTLLRFLARCAMLQQTPTHPT